MPLRQSVTRMRGGSLTDPRNLPVDLRALADDMPDQPFTAAILRNFAAQADFWIAAFDERDATLDRVTGHG